MRQKTCTIIRGIDVDSCLKNASSFGSNRFVSSFAFIIGTFFYCEYIFVPKIWRLSVDARRTRSNFYHLTKWETSHVTFVSYVASYSYFFILSLSFIALPEISFCACNCVSKVPFELLAVAANFYSRKTEQFTTPRTPLLLLADAVVHVFLMFRNNGAVSRDLTSIKFICYSTYVVLSF